MKIVLFIWLSLVSSFGFTSMSLDAENSYLNVMSTKKSSITEIHSFSGLSGSITDTGEVLVHVPLASINTGIDIRDERMRKFLFNTEVFPSAHFTAQILDVAKINALTAGEFIDLRLTGSIAMNNNAVETIINVVAIRQLDGALRVSTKQPFIINAADFDFVKGIMKLKELANLPSISTAVPVTFSVVFK